MSKLGRRRIVKVSLEENPGEPVPGATDLLVYEPQINPTDAVIAREPAGAYGGQGRAERGPAVGTCRFKVELRSDGASALDAGLLVCFQGCGMKLAEGVLAPVTAVSAQKAVTLDVYEDGLQRRLFGAMGTFELTGEVGKQVFVDFTFTGLFANLGDQGLPGTNQTTVRPMMCRAATLLLGLYTPRISRFGINANNPVEAREDITAAEGVAHYLIGPGRKYELTMDPEAVSEATWDALALWLAGEERALEIGLSDGTVNVTLEAPNVQHSAPQSALRDSKAVQEVRAQCNADDGDDEFTITAAAV